MVYIKQHPVQPAWKAIELPAVEVIAPGLTVNAGLVLMALPLIVVDIERRNVRIVLRDMEQPGAMETVFGAMVLVSRSRWPRNGPTLFGAVLHKSVVANIEQQAVLLVLKGMEPNGAMGIVCGIDMLVLRNQTPLDQ